MAKCKDESCRAHIVWGRTERGRGVPLDPHPDAAGELIDTGERSETGEIVLRPLQRDEKDTTSPRYVNHLESCSGAVNFRRQ